MKSIKKDNLLVKIYENRDLMGAAVADAVKEVVTTENIDEHCPASIMRNHPNTVMYCDADSGKYII